MCQCKRRKLGLTFRKFGVVPLGSSVQVRFTSAPRQGGQFSKIALLPEKLQIMIRQFTKSPPIIFSSKLGK